LRWAVVAASVVVGVVGLSPVNAQECCSQLDATCAKPCETYEPLPIAYDTLRDDRDGKAYKTVAIGKQVWMAENLNYRPQTGNSWCYNNDEYYCDIYGRLYDWKTAKAACPAGWHLPSYREWEDLILAVGGEKKRSKSGYDWHCLGRLMAKSGWEWEDINGGGTDDYGFSAMPGGTGKGSSFSDIGGIGYWWTATEYYRGVAYGFRTLFGDFVDSRTTMGQSVRCVRDTPNSVYNGSLGPLRCAVPKTYFPGLIEGTSCKIKGGRSRSDIVREILRNSPSLDYVYIKRWRKSPGLTGKFLLTFAVNDYGKVLSAQITESTLADSALEAMVVANVKKWEFGRIDTPYDATVVTCPVVFSP